MNDKSFYFMINLFCNVSIIRLVYYCFDFNDFFCCLLTFHRSHYKIVHLSSALR